MTSFSKTALSGLEVLPPKLSRQHKRKYGTNIERKKEVKSSWFLVLMEVMEGNVGGLCVNTFLQNVVDGSPFISPNDDHDNQIAMWSGSLTRAQRVL